MSNEQVLPIDQRKLRMLLTPRSRDAHKGLFGHVLVVGGDYGMAGAALMAAESAARTGAGKISVATRVEHIAAFVARRPEIMVHGIDATSNLKALIELASVVVIGPGLGQTRWSKTLMQAALETKLPLVVDADALNLLAHDEIPKQRDNWILTPHPGEASRLLKTKIETIASDRPRYARELQRKHGGIAILKGMGTLIADPEHIHQCSHGNPGMATGGMGDILSGIIGGLLAQGFSLEDAACFGVELHAAAADIAAKKDGERGLMATDLLPPLRSLLNP